MDFSRKKILVTGGAGFLGSHIVARLVAQGVSRDAIETPRSSECDLRDRVDCEQAVLGKDVVIHAAAVTGNAEFHHSHPADIFWDNVVMGVELMEAARKAGVEKFVTIGSVTEYPAEAQSPLREEDIWNGFPESGHAPYSIAKRALLVHGQALRAQYGFSVIHLLMTTIYGPGARPDSGPVPSLIRRVIEAKRKGEDSVDVWGTGKPTRDFLYVEEAARAIVDAARSYDGPMPVNIGSGTETAVADLAKTLFKTLDFSGKLVFDTVKPDGRLRLGLDVSRAEKEFGFRSETALEVGLRKTVEWYNSQI